jgi:hypothetical protein
METYFMACRNPDWSEQEKDQVADSLFNALTSETVNELYTINTIFGPRSVSPLYLAIQTSNLRLAKRLREELRAEITVPVLDYLVGMSFLHYRLVGPVQDAITPEFMKDLIATAPTDIHRILSHKLLKLCFPPDEIQKFIKSLRTAVQEAAWRRRRHILHGV